VTDKSFFVCVVELYYVCDLVFLWVSREKKTPHFSVQKNIVMNCGSDFPGIGEERVVL